MSDTIISMIQLTFVYSTPLIIAGLGGIFSERAGVINIALEGLMLVGAFAAATVQVKLADPNPWISIVVALLAGCVFSILHAVASVNFKADQCVSGTAINIMAGGITVYLAEVIFNQKRTEQFERGFSKVDIPFLGDIYPTIFIAIILVVITHFIFTKTRYGLRVRSCGEYPQATDSAGINVFLYRYSAILISGALAGLAGGIKVLTQDTQFTIISIRGAGFIALAAVIFGRWDARGVLAAGLFFGFSSVLGVYAKDIPFISNFPIDVFNLLPYLLTIIALVITSGKTAAPKAVGEIYDKGKR